MNRTPIQLAATVVGLSFLVAGVGGFIPGITTNAGDIALYGHDSPAMLLGIFQVSVLHNIIHLAFGVAGLAMAKSSAKTYLVGGGVIYLVTWLYGVAIGPATALNFVPLDDADNWLHLAAGLGMALAGIVLGKTPAHKA
jgi:ABC-type transport system involved in multi-copper enzyme maturation permease subunit